MRTIRSWIRRRWSNLIGLGMAIGSGLWTAIPLWAQQETPSVTEKAAASSPATWAIPYIVVIAVLGLGVFCVVLPAKRLERPKKEL